jgi:predicted DNA-binding transcriptional regulator YafY
MRADRLLSLLMLLQTRGSMTAQEIARELEVSERTVYRDMTALSAAGVPVYAERGPGGGCSLLEDYRTNLTGLTADEVRALFMLSIPAPLDQLGVGQELRAALLKLSAALPASRRADEQSSRQRIYLDASGWFQSEESVPHLKTLQAALWQDRKLDLTYRSDFETEIDMLISPYGLVAKATVWYLVGGREDHIRVLRVSRITEAKISPEIFERPPEFDLATFWKTWREDFEESRSRYNVSARIAPELIPALPQYFGDAATSILSNAAQADANGWVKVTLPFESFFAARTRILGFGNTIEVVEPLAMRRSVIDFAEQILNFYSGDPYRPYPQPGNG